jgi:hypothetical protein
MGSPVDFVLDPRRNKRKKSSVSVATQMLVISYTFFGTPHLQHQIDAPWQMTPFRMPNNNGNSIIEIT